MPQYTAVQKIVIYQCMMMTFAVMEKGGKKMRLIDADALKATLGMKDDCSECGDAWKACHYDRIYPKLDFCEWIDDAPTVDTVPVVRCGECKHLMADGRCFEFADDNIRPSVSDFCSYGERREEDGKSMDLY